MITEIQEKKNEEVVAGLEEEVREYEEKVDGLNEELAEVKEER